MNNSKDIIPLFKWAEANGEAIIIDRVLMKNMPEILKYKVEITRSSIMDKKSLKLDSKLFDILKKTIEELVGSSYKDL